MPERDGKPDAPAPVASAEKPVDFLAAFRDPEAVSRYAEGPRRFVPGFDALHRMTSLLLAEATPPEARVLVLGAGGGLELKALAEAHAGWRFVGVDPAREMLREAERRLRSLMDRVTLFEGYVDAAPGGPFDAATWGGAGLMRSLRPSCDVGPRRRLLMRAACVALAATLGGCAATPTPEAEQASVSVSPAERECLIRAMYFESNRSSDQGLRAVGTVVMNRLASPLYPKTICGVVGQPGQFAAGALSQPMRADEEDRVGRIADQVLAGQSEAAVAGAMHFHRAGLRFHYGNMRYVLVAGGNAFYEKRPNRRRRLGASPAGTPSTIEGAMSASAPARPPDGGQKGGPM